MPQSFDSLHLIGSIDIHVESMEPCQESPDLYSALSYCKGLFARLSYVHVGRVGILGSLPFYHNVPFASLLVSESLP